MTGGARKRFPIAPHGRRGVLAAALGFALGILATPAFAQSMDVRMEEKFVPARLTVKVGTTVRWINTEKRTSHSVHFAAEGLPESERMFPGESWQRRFDKPGVYPYVCGPHPHMQGVIEVVP